MDPKYGKICLGGTFDLPLHKGHRLLLMWASLLGDSVLVAMRSDRYLRENPKPHPVAPYQERERAVSEFMDRFGSCYDIKPLEGNVYNPGLVTGGSDVDAIIVSEETVAGAEEINAARKESGLSPLYVEKIRLVRAEDGERVSSTRIREGKIDEKGRLLQPI